MVVVDGFFDAAKVWQAGHRNVVALMGSSLSDVQAGLLHKHFRLAVLMLDGDAAGQTATEAIARRLSSVMDLEPIRPKPGYSAGPTGSQRNQRHSILPSTTSQRSGTLIPLE